MAARVFVRFTAVVLGALLLPSATWTGGRSRVFGAEPPDLSVAWTTGAIRWSVNPETVEGRLRGRLLVTNLGGDAVATEAAILLSGDNLDDPEDQVVGTVSIPALKAGRSVSVGVDIDLPSVPPPAVQYVLAVADPDGVLGEEALANNTAARGPFTSGDEFFPHAPGDAGFFRGIAREPGTKDRPYLSLSQWSAPTMFLGVPAQSLLRTHAEGDAAPRRDFFDRAARGIRFLGNDDSGDPLVPQIAPYDDALFPFQGGLRWTPVARTDLDFGEDLDGDAINEIGTQTTTMSVRGPSRLATSLGTLSGCLRKTESIRLVVVGSSAGRRVTVQGKLVTWLAPGVGEVSREWTIRRGSRVLSSGEEDLVGYAAGEAGAGIVSDLPLATGLAGGDSDLGSPGQPVLDADPEGFLLVTNRLESLYDGNLVALRLSPNGLAVGETVINPVGYSPAHSAAAFDGTNHLVAHDTGGKIRILRIGTDGGFADAAPGVEISTGTSNFHPAVAYGGTGWLVAWAHFDGLQYDIHAALVAPDGTAAGEFALYTSPGEQVYPLAAFDGTNYLVAWRDTASGAGPSADTDVRGTRVSAAGAILDAGGILLGGGAGVDEPAALAGGNGHCLLVWNNTIGSNPTGLRVARISSAGTAVDGTGSGVAAVPPGLGVVIAGAAFDGTRYLLVGVRPSYFPPNEVFAVSIPGVGPFTAPADLAATIPISGTPPRTRFAFPAVARQGGRWFIAWLDNVEYQDTVKGILGTILYTDE